MLRADGETIAYLQRDGKPPNVLWLGGFKSDMGGTKAEALDRWAARHGHSYLRFDYYGHGGSSGNFRDGTISRWRDDALAVLDRLCRGPQILVGSSMGAWIGLLIAQRRPEQVAGMLLLAPAADFTESLVWARMNPEIQREIMEKGEWMRSSAYEDGAYPITRALIEDGRKNLILGGPIAIDCPIHILQGMQDPDVPWQHALRLVEQLTGNPTLSLIKNGDHRLSTPADLKRIEHALDGLLTQTSA
ncbi:MAG TPA: alpha/beta hydrolase [Micropepsaceae bacterium]|nr:alpha/beta hydrolase [Micropepsaceae bacterium]